VWSAAAHIRGTDDALVRTAPLLDVVGEWCAFLACGLDREKVESIRHHERTGRPLGDDAFVTMVENALGRVLRPRKAGRKPKTGTK